MEREKPREDKMENKIKKVQWCRNGSPCWGATLVCVSGSQVNENDWSRLSRQTLFRGEKNMTLLCQDGFSLSPEVSSEFAMWLAPLPFNVSDRLPFCFAIFIVCPPVPFQFVLKMLKIQLACFYGAQKRGLQTRRLRTKSQTNTHTIFQDF